MRHPGTCDAERFVGVLSGGPAVPSPRPGSFTIGRPRECWDAAAPCDLDAEALDGTDPEVGCVPPGCIEEEDNVAACEPAALGPQPLSEQEPNVCVVCLEAHVEVLLLPCRHAVMCGSCASDVRGNGRCPVCRGFIISTMRGEYSGGYVELVTSLQDHIGRVGASAYQNMYDHVSYFMLFGFTLAVISIPLHFIHRPSFRVLGLCVLTLGVLTAYVPWFLATMQAFESAPAGTGTLCSQRDLQKPAHFFCKLLMLTLAGPCFLVLFFIPYFLWSFVVRPSFRCLLFVSIRGTCLTNVLAVRPLRRRLGCIGEGLRRALVHLCWMLEGMIQRLCACVGACCHMVEQRVLLPVCRFLAKIATWCWQVALVAFMCCADLLRPCCRALAACAAVVGRCGSALASAISSAAVAIYVWTIGPVVHLLAHLGTFLTSCVSAFYGGLARGISRGAAALYEHVIMPLWRHLGYPCFLAIYRCSGFIFAVVVQPVVNVTRALLQVLVTLARDSVDTIREWMVSLGQSFRPK
mmetsp:Transcript_56398/g.183220  ORF Transcript_56398/g.183220 Transcript_56398/m.183220 type:complete len:521 (+) Transcript_56398:100-1662(+)